MGFPFLPHTISTKQGKYIDFTFRDLTDDIPEIQAHWQKENIKFKAIHTVNLGSIDRNYQNGSRNKL